MKRKHPTLRLICIAGMFIPALLSAQVASADDPNKDIAGQINSGVVPNLDELAIDLTSVAESMRFTDWNTETPRRYVGNDLTVIAAQFSVVQNTNDLFKLVNQYLLAAPPKSPSFKADLDKLETDLGTLPLPKQPPPGEVPALSRILAKAAEHLQKISDDIGATNLNALAVNVSDLGYDITKLGIKETLWPASQRTEKFLDVSRELSLKDTASNNWGHIFLWSGAKILNPYSIQNVNGLETLQTSGTTSDGFIEIDFNENYVMRSGSFDEWPLPWTHNQDELPNDSAFRLICPWSDYPDLSGSFGYVFGPSGSTNNYSASTIVGSSDIYSSISFGFPFLRYCSGDYSLKQQFAIQVDGGFTTDKAFDSVHPTAFVGMGYTAKFPMPVGSQNLPVYWFNRVGVAWIDQPELTSSNVVFTTSNNGGLPEPEFRLKFVPISMGTTIIIPVSSSISLQAGGNVYVTKNPPPSWNITLGVSLDLSKLASGLNTGLGLSQ